MIDQAALLRNNKQIENIRQQYFKLAKSIEDMIPVFTRFKKEYIEIVSQNFGAQGRIMEREKWKQWTPKYSAWKRKKYPGKPYLEITGELKTMALHPETVITKDKMTMTVKGRDYLYYVSDREKYGRKYFYTKTKGMPIQAWRIFLAILKDVIEKSTKWQIGDMNTGLRGI